MSETKEETQSVNQTLRITSKESSTDQRMKCSKCDKVFKSKDKSVTCGTCQHTFHAKCQNVSDKKYETLKDEGDDTLWLCLSCNQVTRGMVQNIVSIQQRVKTLEEDMASKADRTEVQQLGTRLNNFMQGAKNRLETKADKDKMEDLSQRVDTIEQKVNNGNVDKDTEELGRLLEAKLKEQQELINQQQAVSRNESKQNESSVTDAVKELEDRERRKNNLIFHNLKESTEATPQGKRLDDANKIKQLCKDHLKIDVEIQNDKTGQPLVFRLGKKDDSKSRSVKVIVAKGEAQKVLIRAKDLNSSIDPDVKKIIVKPDLTPMQREEENKLVKEKNEKNKEAKEKNEPEDWIIQRWKVVRRNRPRPIQRVEAQTSTSSLNEEFTDADQTQ